jgi:hypothetical protein
MDWSNFLVWVMIRGMFASFILLMGMASTARAAWHRSSGLKDYLGWFSACAGFALCISGLLGFMGAFVISGIIYWETSQIRESIYSYFIVDLLFILTGGLVIRLQREWSRWLLGR